MNLHRLVALIKLTQTSIKCHSNFTELYTRFNCSEPVVEVALPTKNFYDRVVDPPLGEGVSPTFVK